jgi:SAM-dependent methyltransferase
MPLRYTRTDLFPDDTNALPTANSREQAALLQDELDIANEDYFERLQQFSDVTDNIYPELMTATRNVVAEALPGRPLRVLDLCSGVGIVSIELIKADVNVRSLTLADMSGEILDRATRLLTKKFGSALPTIDTVVTDLLIDDLRVKARGPYDLVITCNAFQHFPRERQAELFAQIQDILTPSGVFIFESHFKLLRPRWKESLVLEYQAKLRRSGAPAAFLQTAADHIQQFHNYVNLADAYNWFEAAGFSFFECAFRKDEIGIFAAVR